MTTPAGRIISRAMPQGDGAIDHGLNSLSKAVRCFRFRLPNRLQNPHDKSCINISDWNLPDDGIGVSFKSAAPLRRMFWISPTGPVRFNVVLGTFLESHILSSHQLRGDPFCAAIFNGINAITKHLAAFQSFVSSLSERYIGVRP